ncbi:MAG: NADP-dependent malic enzyme [Thermoflavifilum sp.]|nr:NADP-dependent malic enzyme [Thermoflavifilum sp.]QOR76593.1 MAG: NADP-dependent malic enzyme [Thermoflavifilum sp.]
MPDSTQQQDALHYHAKERPGKIEVVPTKETKSQRDLSLAYTPGVAEPCRAIQQNPEAAYQYTARGNLVAVITNGTAVLGLGDIGPEASKPVMEGKSVLFKMFADIDVFDLELNVRDVDEFVRVVKALEPTFGGINLEDVKSPECFYIEERLRQEMRIPVMHDDQHGTAIISGAALINALQLVHKRMDQVKIVVSGAGAAAIACVKLYMALGARKENIIMFDKDGLLSVDRTDLDDIRRQFATDRPVKSMAEALQGADVFLGLSVGNVLTADMLKGMAENPIVFALANPVPEIDYETAVEARPDIIMATGRSDYPNQVNNVLGFPYIFRGALDVRATQINEAMKLAAVHALAELARQPVPDIVNIAYKEKTLSFGRHYIIPKPFDPRLITTVAPAVARAAMESGVAQRPISDWEAYRVELNNRLGLDNQLIRSLGALARKDPRRVVFADADNVKILKAARIVLEEKIAYPILLGDARKIQRLMQENGIELPGVPIIDPQADELEEKRLRFGEIYFDKRKRRGVNLYEAKKAMRSRTPFGCMMVETGEADAFISGLLRNYPDTIRPALQIIGTEPGVKRVAGMYIILTRKGPLFLADTTINLNPSSEELADITLLVAREVEQFGIKPVVAMLSYSNFGTSDTPEAILVRDAVQIVKQKNPDLLVDGEIQASLAFNKEVLRDNYPFTDLLKGDVNTLIFPNLAAGNIAYHLLMGVAGFEAIGPILLGMKKPVHVLQLGSTVRQIVNMVTIAVVDAQQKCRRQEEHQQ